MTASETAKVFSRPSKSEKCLSALYLVKNG
jgi:hypothetical protein